MNKRIIGFILGIITLVVIVFAATAIGSTDNCVIGAQDKPPPGVPTPNAQQLQEWPTVLAEHLQKQEILALSVSAREGPAIPPDFTKFPWIDAQPAELGSPTEDLSYPVGGFTEFPQIAVGESDVVLEDAPCA